MFKFVSECFPGGHDGHERLACSERYDPETQTWTLLSPMRNARSSFAMSRIDDYLLVSGGYDGTSTLSKGEIYDIYEDKW